MFKDGIEWKYLDIYPEIENIYIVSEFGKIKTVSRLVFVKQGTIRSAYYRHYKSRILIPRTNKLHPHLFLTLMRVIDEVKWVKTIYIHKIVAQLYIPKPSLRHKYVEHIDDDYSNNHYSNLRWITHSQLQLRNMNERYPQNKNRLKNKNILSGYYKICGERLKHRERIKSKPYYELKGNSLFNNHTNKRASILNKSLSPIYNEFSHKLVNQYIFKFQRLTILERIRINELIPNILTQKIHE